MIVLLNSSWRSESVGTAISQVIVQWDRRGYKETSGAIPIVANCANGWNSEVLTTLFKQYPTIINYIRYVYIYIHISIIFNHDELSIIHHDQPSLLSMISSNINSMTYHRSTMADHHFHLHDPTEPLSIVVKKYQPICFQLPLHCSR